jgi:hypothetical protein
MHKNQISHIGFGHCSSTWGNHTLYSEIKFDSGTKKFQVTSGKKSIYYQKNGTKYFKDNLRCMGHI